MSDVLELQRKTFREMANIIENHCAALDLFLESQNNDSENLLSDSFDDLALLAQRLRWASK